MHSTTLKGIFPEPKPQHKRNFIKENVRHIKQIQGLLQPSEEVVLSRSRDDKYRSVPPKVSSQYSARVTKSRTKIGQPQPTLEIELMQNKAQKPTQTKPKLKPAGKPKLEIRQLRDFGEIMRKDDVSDYQAVEKEKITHRGIQTERNDDMNTIYDCGVIKYPSAAVVQEISSARRRSKRNDHGDSANVTSTTLEDKTQGLSVSEHDDKTDYIKHNINAIKVKSSKPEAGTSTNNLPPNYQKGALPKYLKERKEEQLKDKPEDSECPLGHVLLPEEERKETLRVLRQSYADRIQELNTMPVRNDTLKMRRRKMELEEELKKIDEGIKVFQRPKVFVKINA